TSLRKGLINDVSPHRLAPHDERYQTHHPHEPVHTASFQSGDTSSIQRHRVSSAIWLPTEPGQIAHAQQAHPTHPLLHQAEFMSSSMCCSVKRPCARLVP